MSAMTIAHTPQAEAAPRAAPIRTTGPIAWARANLFASWWSTAVTLVLAYLCLLYTSPSPRD